MKKSLFILFGGLLYLSSFAQELVRESKEYPNFSKLDVSNGMNIFISKADTCSVTLETNNYVLESAAIKINVSNGTLKLILDDKYNKQNFNNATINIYIKMSSINYLSASQNSHIYIEDEFSTDDMTVNVNAQGKIFFNNNLIINNRVNLNTNNKGYIRASSLIAKSLDLKASIGSEITIDHILIEDNIECNVNNNSIVTIKGKAKDGVLLVTSRSELKLKNLEIQNVNAIAATSSTIHVEAKQQLIATATNRAIIFYSGKPKTLSKEATSGGKITNRKIL